MRCNRFSPPARMPGGLAVVLGGLAVALGGLTPPLSGQSHAAALDQPLARPLLGFGVSAAAAGDEVFVGRPGEFGVFPMPGSEPGSVHIFQRSDDGWEEYASVTAPDGSVGDGFGAAVAVEGDILLVGAPGEDDGRGAAYAFGRSGDGWEFLERTYDPEGEPGDRFGAAVALRAGEDVAGIVGAPGRDGVGGALAFWESDGEWTTQVLTGSAAAEEGRFGASVAIEGDLALVGAPGPFAISFVAGPPQFQPGSGYVFRMTGDGWSEEAHLTTGGGAVGVSTALVDGEALLGSPLADQANGAVFRFAPGDAGQWELASRLGAASPASQGFYGYAMAAAGERIVVGAPGVNAFSGAAYVLQRTPEGDWVEETMLTAETTGLMGWMGNAVAGGEDFVIVGAPGSEFFEGIGFTFTLSDGSWVTSGEIVESEGGLAAITGGEMPCSEDGEVAGFDCRDVELVSFLPVDEVGGGRGIMVSDVWGWTDPDTGREYAILGRFDGTSFIDVTDAENPRYLGSLPLTGGAQANLWRDMKVYANHAFIVADNAGQHGIQVFDLTRLRDVSDGPIEFDEDAIFDDFASAHNIVINEETGFAYAVGGSGGGQTCGGALIMVDIRDPKNPTFTGCYSDPDTGMNGPGYTHDAQCVIYRGPDADYQGREICFNASESALGIGDVTDKDDPTPISSATYPNVAYAHQGWLSEDQSYFYLNDELDELQGGAAGTRTLVWDVTDLDDPVLANEHVADNAASDHNLYVRGQFMYQSNYVSGLRIFDISDAENPTPVAHFDTVPWGEDQPGFAGSWSNYPFFESGNILVSSMREGLFILKKRQPELVP